MSSNLLNALHTPSIRVRKHSEIGWWAILWEVEWKHAQSHSSWEHKGLSENSIRTSGRWPWKHSGERFGRSNDVNTRPINRGIRERESEQTLRRSIKWWQLCQVAVPPSRSSSWRQAEGLAFIQLGGPFPPAPCFLCFFLFSLFTIRVVYNSFTCSHRIFGSPSLAVLYWIGKDGWFFQSLRALKCMQAGIQSP